MGDSSLVPFDAKLAKSVSYVVKAGGAKMIEFQFAPKILSESNSSRWQESDIFGVEPLRIFWGASGREILVEWEYVATDKQWTATKIAGIVRDLKSYFFEFKQTTYPIVELKYMEVIPTVTKFRLRNADITYSPEIVDNGGIYPLHTKVATKLQLATSVGSKDEQQAKMKNNALLPPTPAEWY